jgi:hypothetical protein
MKKRFFSLLFFFIISVCTYAESEVPDTVLTGIYITSIHDIDFRQKEYTINFWIWFNYERPEFNFTKYLEIPQAKTVSTLYSLDSTTESGKYVLLKLQCVMKDSWKINSYPFNHQNLRLTIENAQYDKSSLVFARDTVGQIYDDHALTGWGADSSLGWHFVPDSVKISIGTKNYETTFGDASVEKPHMVYSAYKVKIGIQRDAWGLFWKLFLAMYIAFLIAYVSFYIHLDNIDSRFGLTVGSLFAVIGNKYIIESSLPESSSFTLVDMLHAVTLGFIVCVIAATSYVLILKKKGQVQKAANFNKRIAQMLLLVYVILNIYIVSQAN